jgi:hypothetical protein
LPRTGGAPARSAESLCSLRGVVNGTSMFPGSALSLPRAGSARGGSYFIGGGHRGTHGQQIGGEPAADVVRLANPVAVEGNSVDLALDAFDDAKPQGGRSITKTFRIPISAVEKNVGPAFFQLLGTPPLVRRTCETGDFTSSRCCT